MSQSLIDIATEVLQPDTVTEDDQCGYLMKTTHISATDWLIGPCNQKTDPGAFLCKINASITHNTAWDAEIAVKTNNTVEYNLACPTGWTLMAGVCFVIYNETKMALCPHKNKLIINESIEFHMHDWLSYYIMHGALNCTKIKYRHSTGVKLMHSATSKEFAHQCILCATEAEVVDGCPQGLFHCDDGSCVTPTSVCDGKWDCFHGDDESKCDISMCHIDNMYQKSEFCRTECSIDKHICLCSLDFWQCTRGGCISISKFCDYQVDCEDASDELCQTSLCDYGEIPCKNGQCIPKQDIFDFERNCLDNSDEYNNKYLYSHVNILQCETLDICMIDVPPIRINDLIPDCMFSYDEPLYWEMFDKGTVKYNNLCLPHHLPCLQFHSQCFPVDKLCVYELDIGQQMMHCRNGFHVQNCTKSPCRQAFKCVSSYCIPVHYICDGVWHCPDGEDEQHCSVAITRLCQRHDLKIIDKSLPPYVYKHFLNGSCIPAIIPQYNTESSSLSNQLSCPGLFRCQYGQCLHASLLCDGIIHCPLFADDETSCIHDSCPDDCTCLGKAVYCIGTKPENLLALTADVYQLVFMHNNASGRLSSLDRYSHLLKVDVSFNRFIAVSDSAFKLLLKLSHLDVSHNRLVAAPSLHTNRALMFLNLSCNFIEFLPNDLFLNTTALQFLDLSCNMLKELQSNTFGGIQELHFLSLVDNEIIDFDPNLLKYFKMVDILISDQYQHCCVAENVGTCSSTDDGFSTCEALLANSAIKVMVYLVGAVGMAANIYVICSRVKCKHSHSKLIVGLALADAAYSVYLRAIGVADAYYAGAYILYDDWWRNSFLCKTLSFLSIFSSESSIAILMCITIDRYVNIFKTTNVKPQIADVQLSTVLLPVAWILTFIISLLPFFLSWMYDNTYSASNSICIFLEITSERTYISVYLLCVFVVTHGLCFLTILIIYAKIIYLHIQSAKRVGRKANLNLVKRTLLIVLTNFLCWAPLAGFICVFLWRYGSFI